MSHNVNKHSMEYHHYLLKQGNYSFKDVFKCPFCRNQHSSLTNLRKHADELSRDTSVPNKDSATKHSALKRYIDVDLSYDDRMNLIKKKIHIDDKLESEVKADNAELFVYPWMAIVVNNVSIYDPESKNSVRKNDEQIKEEMLRLLEKKEDELRLKVTPLWDKKGVQTRLTVVEFEKNMDGFHNARRLENIFRAKKRGKEDYHSRGHQGRGDELYGWMARLEDYEDYDYKFGKHLRNRGLLKRVSREEAEAEAEDL